DIVREARYYPSIDDGNAKKGIRAPSRNTRPSDPEGAGAGPNAWLWDRFAIETRLRRCAAGGRELALSGAAAVAAQWLGESRMGSIGKQSSGAVLFLD